MSRLDREATRGGVYGAVTEMLDDNLRREVLRSRHQGGRPGGRGVRVRVRGARGHPMIPNDHHLVVKYRLGSGGAPPAWSTKPIVAWDYEGQPLVVGRKALVRAGSIREMGGVPVLSWSIHQPHPSALTR